jgi:hypothetical protein
MGLLLQQYQSHQHLPLQLVSLQLPALMQLQMQQHTFRQKLTAAAEVTAAAADV